MCQTWKYKASVLGSYLLVKMQTIQLAVIVKLEEMLWGQSTSEKADKSWFFSELSPDPSHPVGPQSDQCIIQLRDPQALQAGLSSEVQAPHPSREHKQKQSLKVHPVGRKNRKKRRRKGNHHCLPELSEDRETRSPQNARHRRSQPGLAFDSSLLEYLPQWGTHYHSGARKLLTAQVLEQTNMCVRVCMCVRMKFCCCCGWWCLVVKSWLTLQPYGL